MYRNCDYPQELILELDSIHRITQIQVLSHQSHIATKIELYLSEDNVTYKRLGFLCLKSNKESQYTARELKTVHIDAIAKFVKLKLHECYINQQTAPQELPQQHQQPSDDLDIQFDSKTASKIREIQIAKEKAVAMEDYDQVNTVIFLFTYCKLCLIFVSFISIYRPND